MFGIKKERPYDGKINFCFVHREGGPKGTLTATWWDTRDLTRKWGGKIRTTSSRSAYFNN